MNSHNYRRNEFSVEKELNIKDDESNFRNFFNNIDDFLFVLDLNGNIIETNNAVTRLLGYTKEELIGKNVLFVHPPEFRDQAQITVGEMISGISESCPIPLISKTNTYIPVETRVYFGNWNGEKSLIGVSRNLSEIAFSESKFHEVFDNSPEIMAISEIDSGIFIDANKIFLNTLGYTKSEIIGKKSSDLKLFQDPLIRSEIVQKINNNITLENENVITQTKNGQLLNFLFSATKIKIQTKEYLLTSASDVTQIKNIEKKLNHNLLQQTLLADISQNLNSLNKIEQKLNDTIELLGKHTNVSRVYIFEDEADGLTTNNTFEWCNESISPQIEELQGIPYEAIPSWKKILNENGKVFSTNIKELPDDLYQILEPQGIKSILVLPLYVKEKFYGFMGFDECVLNKTWEHDEIELLRTISNIISNTFERIIIKKQLSKSKEQLSMAIENTEAGLWDWNIVTGEVYFSDIWLRMLGYDRSEVEPNVSSWEKLVHPDDMPDVEKALNDHLTGKTEFYEATHRLLCKSGAWTWVLDKGKVIERDAHWNPIRAIGTHFNIENQKETELELKRINATKDKFFSIIAHDLRGPIGALMQMIDYINDKEDEISNDVLFSFLKKLKYLTKDTFTLLENLLYWSMESNNELLAEPKIINAKDIIKTNIGLSNYISKSKNQTITAEINDDFFVYADENMVNLIFRNLLSNAMKFTPINGKIKISVIENSQFVQISILDSGGGISKENIEKILSDDNFHTSRGTSNEKGTGLGLKLCKDFIKKNNGAFFIESKIGKGSTFVFTLPKP
ncbi:MAG: PAS domain S-box protein [Bacteroidetes bacterium]|nr:PAS domain S-box protein [Bacteroidota bacterium]